MKTTLSTLFLLLLLWSCNHQKPSSNDLSNTAKADSFENSSKEAVNIDDFPIFWKTFRESIIDMDTLKIHEMCNLPLLLKGYQDSDPILRTNNHNLIKTIKIFLEQENDADYDNNISFIKATSDVEKYRYYNNTIDSRRMGDMVFDKINGKWKLSLIYLDTQSLHNER